MAHLGDQLSAYVDGRLSPAVLYAWDRHVVVCLACRQRVDEERRLLASLRAAPAPGISASLQAMLLSLAEPTFTSPQPATTPSVETGSGNWVQRTVAAYPPIPRAPEGLRGGIPDRLSAAAGAPALPALHRSLRRSIALAAVAAGASATAAWTLALVQTPAAIQSTPAAATARADDALTGALTARIGYVPAPTAHVRPAWSTMTATDPAR